VAGDVRASPRRAALAALGEPTPYADHVVAMSVPTVPPKPMVDLDVAVGSDAALLVAVDRLCTASSRGPRGRVRQRLRPPRRGEE
jgi:hypothetical protein